MAIGSIVTEPRRSNACQREIEADIQQPGSVVANGGQDHGDMINTPPKGPRELKTAIFLCPWRQARLSRLGLEADHPLLFLPDVVPEL